MAAAEDRRASWVPAALILALSLVFGAAAMVAGYRARSAERRATSRRRLQGALRRGHPGLRRPGGGAPTPQDAPRAHDPRLDHHRAEPQQQRRPSRGEHAAHRGLAARRGTRGGPPAVLHGGAAEPLVQPGRGGRRGPVVRSVRRVVVRHHLPAAARRRRGHRRGARRAPAVPGARGPRADRRLGRPGLPGAGEPAQPRDRRDARGDRRADRAAQPPRRRRHAAADARAGRAQLRPPLRDPPRPRPLQGDQRHLRPRPRRRGPRRRSGPGCATSCARATSPVATAARSS